MRLKHTLISCAVLALGALASPGAMATPTPQSGVCPAIGSLSGTTCNVEIFAGSGGAFNTIVPNTFPYDSVEDNLVGIINNSGKIISSLTFTTPAGGAYPLFGFDFDGLQTFGGAGNDPTGYGGMTSLGENTTFTNISPSQNTGTVVFGASGIPDGGTAYFSLEGPPDVNLKPTSALPEPSTIALFGIGLLGVGFGARRKRRHC